MHNAIIEAGYIERLPEQFIEFHSQGRLLIRGNAAAIDVVLPHLAGLHITCVTDKALNRADLAASVLVDKVESIDGWLGKFTAQLTTQAIQVDLILDLADSPLMTRKVLPLGYFAPRQNQQALVEALQQLPDLIGIFDKPKFFNYKAATCAHSRRSLRGCQQCIDSCPAEAIQSVGEFVSVNPSLCQGCGSCVTVCPSGAMSYALPTLDVSVNRLRKMMQAYAELETQPPHILIHDDINGRQLLESQQSRLKNNVIPFSIEEIGALSMPFWLSAIAFGAASVTVWDAASHPDHNWLELQQQISATRDLLQGLGLLQQLNWFAGNDFAKLTAYFAALPDLLPVVEAARFAGIDDKRKMTTMALTHLHQQATKPPVSLVLKAGAAFGEIEVDKKTCTLCMSCVSVCPVGAVVDGVDKPQLNFIEDLCVQCGLCEQACPENAIDLKPRYLFNRSQASQKRLLHEQPVFHCISCNKPFATQKMIEMMTEKLKGHAMFQGAAAERLKMCEDCRVEALFHQAQGRE